MASAEEHTDLFMYFQPYKGSQLHSETMTEIKNAEDPDVLIEDFLPGCIFEIDSFRLAIGVKDEDEAEEDDGDANGAERNGRGAQSARGAQHSRGNSSTSHNKGKKKKKKSMSEAFKKWREGGFEEKQYPAEMQPIEFTRTIDKASSALLENFIARQGYRKIVLVKRKSVGGPTAGKLYVTGKAYIRFDFIGALMTEIEWSEDDEEVKETCRFVCREIDIQYLPQLPDGTLGDPISAKFSYA